MAELLVRIIDKGPDDLHSKAGDVIVAHPDGWNWTATERAFEEWMIVCVPGADPSAFEDMARHAPIDSGLRKETRFDPDSSHFKGLVSRAHDNARNRVVTLTGQEHSQLMQTKHAVKKKG